MKTLENDILHFQNLAQFSNNQDLLDKLFKQKTKLSDLLGLKTQGALVRSRYQSVNEMDAPSKYFFNLEKKNGQKRMIHNLKSETGALLSDPVDIRKRAFSFYATLYTSEYREDMVAEQSFFEGLPQVSDLSNEMLCGVITLEEVQKALQSMETGKAPGLDGLPMDFYKSFWTDLKEDLLEVLNDSLAGGLMPVSCRRAVLTLLPKKGDLSDIRSWRPVSLLASEYKLLSKVLATRLGKVMEEVIHPDQSYCVPGRSVFDNISLIRDILDASKVFGLNTAFISIDQEKAFDRVEHSYLWKTLNAFGFSLNFIDKIKVLYKDIESMLKINGGLCSPFKVLRGVRQGCSLSGILYSFAMGVL